VETERKASQSLLWLGLIGGVFGALGAFGSAIKAYQAADWTSGIIALASGFILLSFIVWSGSRLWRVRSQ
jgi:hypothetical protein